MTDQPTSSPTQAGTFQVDFESLIRVLGENLYANPKAAVRELIQNASDSCVRRGVEQMFAPVIHIKTDREARILTIEDNGAGMVQDEVIHYLASIGGGGTREARKRLMTSDQRAARMLIGQFGIGFLSTFVVADRVVVDTRSMVGRIPVHWVCEGTSEYQIGAGARAEPGTRVTLLLKQAHYDLLDEDVLQSTIVRFADFIAFPIYLNGGAKPVNRMNAPWHTEGTETEYAEYLKHRYGVAPLALEPIAVDHEGLQAQGALFIPPRRVEFKRRLRSADIFQKRMYVGEDLQILPEWAGFVCAVMDCSTLDLVASREAAISERPSYKALQEYLAGAVTAFIKRLAEWERPTFLEVIRQHDWPVLWGAIKNDAFFNQVKDIIPIPSDLGPLTVPKYLERVPARLGNIKTIYYVPGEQPIGQQQSSLFKARGVPIYQADIAFEQFLRKYADRSQDVGLRQMVSGVVELMEFVEGPRWRALEGRYQDLDIVAKAVRFHPPEMPAMAVRQADYDQERLIEQIVDGRRTLLDFMTRVGKEKSDAYGLCFNVDNPVIQRLAEYEGDPTVLNTALRAIYSGALLAAGVELTPDLSQTVARSQMRIIELLLEQAARIDTGQTVGPYAISLFDEPAQEKSPERQPLSDPPNWAELLDEDGEEEETDDSTDLS
jgi:molecular chaperone HtpG